MIQSPEREAIASCVSELLLIHTALGDGYVSPIPAAKGLVFTSATNPEVHDQLREAEKAFNAWFDIQLKDDRDELERMEATVKKASGSRGRDTEYVLDPFEPAAVDPAKLKALREKLALQPNVTWREHHFHKTTLLELLTKSACGAMTYIDEDGDRLGSVLSSPRSLAADLSLLSLCKGSADSALIRSSATGGASIHSLKGDYSPAFNYYCSAQPRVVARVSEKISSDVAGASALGKAIVIPVKVSQHPKSMFSEATLLLALKAVYTKGRLRPEEKLQVTYESPELRAAWEAFLDRSVATYVDHDPSPADLDTYDEMPASTRTIALFASRAAVTAAILESLERSVTSNVTLTWNSLKAAELFAQLIFQVSSGEERLAARRGGAAKAHASFKTHEKLFAAEQALVKAIQEAPDNRITRKAARNEVEGLTLGLLDELVKNGKVAEIVTETKGGKVTRHYVLKESVRMDPEEAAAELKSAIEEGELVTRDEAYAAYRELQAKAFMNKIDYHVPVVPITSMTPRQIAAIPRILQDRGDDVVLRGTADNPEPASAVEDGDDGYPVTTGSINLWFRRQPNDVPYQNSWDGVGLSQWNEKKGDDHV